MVMPQDDSQNVYKPNLDCYFYLIVVRKCKLIVQAECAEMRLECYTIDLNGLVTSLFPSSLPGFIQKEYSEQYHIYASILSTHPATRYPPRPRFEMMPRA